MKPSPDYVRTSPRNLDPGDVIRWQGSDREIRSVTYLPRSQTIVRFVGYHRDALLGPFADVWRTAVPTSGKVPRRPEFVR